MEVDDTCLSESSSPSLIHLKFISRWHFTLWRFQHQYLRNLYDETLENCWNIWKCCCHTSYFHCRTI